MKIKDIMKPFIKYCRLRYLVALIMTLIMTLTPLALLIVGIIILLECPVLGVICIISFIFISGLITTIYGEMLEDTIGRNKITNIIRKIIGKSIFWLESRW